MAAEKKYPVSLVVRATDKASGALKAMTSRFAAITGPFARKEFGKNLSALGEALNVKGFANVGAALKNVGTEVFSLAAKFAGLAVGAGVMFAAIIRGAEQAGSRWEDNAARVGLSVDAYAQLEFAAKRGGVENEAFATAIDKLNENMGDMRAGKGGKMLAFLNQVSPALAKQVKGATNTEEALGLMTRALAKIPDSARRAKFASEVFGKSGMQMGAFLAQEGAGGVAKLRAEFERLHGSAGDFAKRAGEMGDASDDAELAFLGLRNAAAAGLFPALTKLTKIGTDFLVKHREGLSKWATETGAAIDRWVAGDGLGRLGRQLMKVADGVSKVIDFLGPVGVAVAAAAVVFGPLILSVGSFGVALIGIMPTLIAFGIAAWTAMAPLLPFIAAGVAIGVAVWKISQEFKVLSANLDAAGIAFDEWKLSVKFAVLDAWKTLRPFVQAMASIPGLGGLGGRAALKLGDFAAANVESGIENQTGQTRAAIEARRPGSGKNTAAVSVDFANLPPGVRVSTPSDSWSGLDLSVGYSVMP